MIAINEELLPLKLKEKRDRAKSMFERTLKKRLCQSGKHPVLIIFSKISGEDEPVQRP